MFLAAHVCTFLVYISEQLAIDDKKQVIIYLFIAQHPNSLDSIRLDKEKKR